MQILLACAKIMQSSTTVSPPMTSIPHFIQQANQIALEVNHWNTNDFMKNLHCNKYLAIENKIRFEDFFNENSKIPAILSYYGQAYKALSAHTFTNNDFLFAQQHLWITSFLYGMLRPLDMIHPYRMEGTVDLEFTNQQTLFSYWQQRLTDMLIESVMADDGILVHLATKEMEHLFNWQRIQEAITIIQPQFLVNKNGKLKTIVVYAKSCRGAMARFMIQHKLNQIDYLEDFTYEGFTFSPKHSDHLHPHFIIE